MDVTPEPLPGYVEHQVPQNAFDTLLTRISFPLIKTHPNARTLLEDYVENHKSPLYCADNSNNTTQVPQPVTEYPPEPKTIAEDTTVLRLEQQIVCELFNAIGREDNEAVLLLIQNNLVTPNTIDKAGRTPLIAAISAGFTTVVKQLLQLGADANAFGTVGQTKRTPLMLAASNGSLPIVKLLFEHPYNADDSLVAPDGQIALRLASSANHAAIVAYLPSRRGGGFLRFKTRHATNIAQMKQAGRAIGYFVRFFLWDIPKFLLWDIPKHVVVLPAVKACKWSWANRTKFIPWCWKQFKETPRRMWKAGKEVGRLVKGLGTALWTFVTRTLPRFGRALAIGIWTLFTQRLPKAITVILKWLWSGISSLGEAVWNVVLKAASLAHAMWTSVISLLQTVTLTDIWNAACDVLRAVFVTLPANMWTWTKTFGTASYKVMAQLLGDFGKLLWWISVGVGKLILYIPQQCWIMVNSMGDSLLSGLHEVQIWINPKSMHS